MLNREWALFCVALLLWPLSARTVCAQTEPGKTTPKEAIAEIPTGAEVEIKLREKAKARGRLAAVTDTSLEVQGVNGSETLAFEDVKSVKMVHRPKIAQVNLLVANFGPAARQHMAKIRDGAIVEVKLHKRSKAHGRLGAVTDTGVEVQYLKNGRLLTETFAFQDVKSVKTVGHPLSFGKKVLIVIGISAGAFIVLLGLAA